MISRRGLISHQFSLPSDFHMAKKKANVPKPQFSFHEQKRAWSVQFTLCPQTQRGVC